MIAPKVQKPTKAEENDAYELVTLRDLDTCQRCRRDCGFGQTSRDHRKNRSQGGLTVPSNLHVLGGSGTTGCHGWVTSHPTEAVAEGWAVPGWADPAEWPARRWFRSQFGMQLGWVIYLNEPNDSGYLWERISDGEAARRMEGLVA